ncbi:hypothetical protein [Nocardioides sp. AE5]|uniref:hypothetical protein n=1 Tax=Nocardioides sp. AE5 TaxID=2962573 RepID=UPI00288108FD|nr:hypothetical protein [Nocardioides sp. AE5]MDT0200543.1 hypothetical protein [Nocardioides sp. AE5]
MNEDPAPRVRISGPHPNRRGVSRPVRRQIDDETPLGAIYMGSLLRDQAKLALRTLLVLGASLGSLPLTFHLFPTLAESRVLGLPLPYLALGIAVYPFLVLLGWVHVRAAEGNERAFTDLVEEDDR